MSLRYLESRLHLEGAALDAIARRAGTPLFAYSASEIRTSLARYQKAFRPLGGLSGPPLICYALKANPLRAIGRILAPTTFPFCTRSCK